MEHTKKIQVFYETRQSKTDFIPSTSHWYIAHVCAVCLLSPPCRYCMTTLLDKAIPLSPDYRGFISRWCGACSNAAFKVLVTVEWKRTWLPLNCVLSICHTPQPRSCRTSPSDLYGRSWGSSVSAGDVTWTSDCFLLPMIYCREQG